MVRASSLNLLVVFIFFFGRTKAQDTSCDIVKEAAVAHLSCAHGGISSVSLALFGELSTSSSCSTKITSDNNCTADISTTISILCVGKCQCNVLCTCGTPGGCFCAVDGVKKIFSGFPCPGVVKSLGIQIVCPTKSVAKKLPPRPRPHSRFLNNEHSKIQALTAPVGLKVEFLDNPIGMDQLQPHFTWIIGIPSDTDKDRVAPQEFQTDAQVVVEDVLTGAIMWDSGKVTTPLPILVPQNRIPFRSDRKYVWAVRVWNSNGEVSPFSSNATFTTGLLQQTDWAGKWIGGGKMFRRDFAVPSEPALGRVSVFVSACQYYQLYIDNSQIGSDHVLDVGWTNFPTNRSYAMYDVSPTVFQPGCHTVGLMVGQGFCTQYTTLLQMNFHSATDDSIFFMLLSDESWSCSSSGPILSDSTYYGELYDARLEQPNWSTINFRPSSSTWGPVNVHSDRIFMSSQLMPPIKRVKEILPLSMNEPTPGVYVFDFGQEFTGFLRVKIPQGTVPGTNITLRHAEVLQHPPHGPFDGTIYMGNLFWCSPIDFYFTSAENSVPQEYEPRFTYHGFRYADLAANPQLPSPPTVDSVVGIVIRSSVSESSAIQIGNSLLNRISMNSWWTEAAALMSIPAGCAARGERNGWTGDAAFGSESEMFDFDTGAFFTRYLDQIVDSMCTDGSIGNGIPLGAPWGECGGESDLSWGTVFPTIAWNLWKYYGAVGAIQKHYDALTKYIKFTDSLYANSGLQYILSMWGDWNPAFPLPRTDTFSVDFIRTISHITSAASFLHDRIHMIDLAEAVGAMDDAHMYRQRVGDLRKEFHQVFYDPVKKMYGDGTLTAQAVAIWLNVVPPSELNSVIANLVAQIEKNFDGHSVGIGFIGVRYLFESLSKVNRTDISLKMLLQTTYPGFGYEITNQYEPATSLWECFDGDTMHQWIDESSRDHHYQTSINTFFRKYVIGLDMPEQVTAFSVIKIRPEATLVGPKITNSLKWVNLTVNTQKGKVTVSWNFLRLPPEIPGPPDAPAPASPCGVQPQFPIPAGGLQSLQSYINLTCPVGQVIGSITYAKIGVPSGWENGTFTQAGAGWFCFGPQPPPKGFCEKDISGDIAKSCIGKSFCKIPATKDAYGNTCSTSKGPYGVDFQVAVRVNCTGSYATEFSSKRSLPKSGIPSFKSEVEPPQPLMELNVTIPLGSTAEIHVPNFYASPTILESGVVVWANRTFVRGRVGVQSGVDDGRFIIFSTLSGAYKFLVVL